MANKVVSFINETKTELRKVTWPTRHEVLGATMIVLVVMAVLGVFCGVFDFLFSLFIRVVIR